MKKILIIFAVISLTACKTENIYLSIFPVKSVTEVIDTITIYEIPDNRFKREFYVSDSIFSVIEKASDEAMRSATSKTKHLNL